VQSNGSAPSGIAELASSERTDLSVMVWLPYAHACFAQSPSASESLAYTPPAAAVSTDEFMFH